VSARFCVLFGALGYLGCGPSEARPGTGVDSGTRGDAAIVSDAPAVRQDARPDQRTAADADPGGAPADAMIELDTAAADQAADPPLSDGGANLPGNWPANASQTLPHGNIMYGNSGFGDNPNHGRQYVHQGAARFRAQKTGDITAVKIHLRTCTSGSACSSSSYSTGNGGRLSFAVHTDVNGLPGAILARGTRTLVPLESASIGSSNEWVALDRSVAVTAGTMYHVVNTQLEPDRGRVVLNGDGVFRATSYPGGPFGGNGPATFTRNSDTESWSRQRMTNGDDIRPRLQVRYSDGQVTGNPSGSWNSSHNSALNFGGSTEAGQQFIVGDLTRRATGVWIRFGRRVEDAGPTVLLERSGGDILITAQMPARDISHCAQDTPYRACVIEWVHVPFGQVVTLAVGETYRLRIKAPSAAGYFINGMGETGEDREAWRNAVAQRSSDGGASWSTFSVPGQSTSDFSILFTLEGMPRQLP
jgi:hypothetical protein